MHFSEKSTTQDKLGSSIEKMTCSNISPRTAKLTCYSCAMEHKAALKFKLTAATRKYQG